MEKRMEIMRAIEQMQKPTECIECQGELSGIHKYFCKKCYPLFAGCHIRLREMRDCRNPDCMKKPINVFVWTACQHVACVECYKNTPHQVEYETQRLKNPNTRCPICVKIKNENSELIKNGRRRQQEHIQTET